MEAARAEDARLARNLRRDLQEAEEMIRDEREELVDAMRSCVTPSTSSRTE
jgi:hypothetical protein